MAYTTSSGSRIQQSTYSPLVTCKLLACTASSTNCVRSASAWKKRSSWPVSGVVLGYTRYRKADVVKVLSQTVSSSNALIALSQQLAAAKLNVFYGANPPAAVQTALALGDFAVGNLRPPPLARGGKLAGSLVLRSGTTVAQATAMLAQFNNAAVSSWPHKC
jgi:hypothetical protein